MGVIRSNTMKGRTNKALEVTTRVTVVGGYSHFQESRGTLQFDIIRSNARRAREKKEKERGEDTDVPIG